MKTAFDVTIATELAHTYRDYAILPIPHRDIDSRRISTRTRLTHQIELNIPIVGANMGHLGGRMAEKLAQLGGIGILSQDFSLSEIHTRLKRVKNSNPHFHMPIVLNPENTVAEALVLMNKRHFDCVVVVDSHSAPIGLATHKDLQKVPAWEKLRNVMKHDLLIVHNTISTEEASQMMLHNRINHLPVVDYNQRLLGCLTPLDITLRMHGYRPALDPQGRLRVGVAMGMKPKENIHPRDLVHQYIESGVDVVVLDIANGYLRNFVEYVAEIRQEIGPDFPLIAGNVADEDGAMRLFEAGCDAAKVGIGPGGACTTRRETGVGVPQATAVSCALRAAVKASTASYPRFILADGGITSGFDLAISTLLGASAVMVGSFFAGTFESAFETEIIDGQLWKRWRGNASSSAATYRRKNIYGEKYITEDLDYSEGADGIVKVTGSVSHKVYQLIEGLKRRIAYANADDLASFQTRQKEVLRLRNAEPMGYNHFSQLAFENLYIKPQPTQILSRKQVKLNVNHPPVLELNVPYIALPADFVQKKICTILAQLGGLGFISRKKPQESIQMLVDRIHKVRAHHPYYFFPSIQEQYEEIGKTIDFIRENNFSCAIIVKDVRQDWTPIGIATPGDLNDRPRTDSLTEVIKTNIVTVPEGVDLRAASELMLTKGIHHLPVVNANCQLVGCITPRDITLRVLYGLKPNVDSVGRLKVGAAINVDQVGFDQIMYEAILLYDTGIYALLLDTEDGHAEPYLAMIRKLREHLDCKIVGSGVCTYEGAKALFEAGADIIKVGSRFCEIPHIEAINQCARAAVEMGRAIFPDDRNTVQHPRDANLTLLLGAQAVGLRDILAPTFENSVQSIYSGENPRKVLATRLIRRFMGTTEYIMEDLDGELEPDIKPLKIQGSVINVIVRLLTGLQSACTYSNAGNLADFQRRAVIGIQSPSGYQEGNPHAFD